MGMVVNQDRKEAAPKASKQIDRDSARRYRAVPADVVIQKSKDTVWIPRQFMLGDTEASELFFALHSRVETLEKILTDLGHGIVPSAQVLPMRRNAKATEQSKVSQARPEPVPSTQVEGNAALAMPVPSPDSPTEDSKPSVGEVVQLPTNAANDEDQAGLVVEGPKENPDKGVSDGLYAYAKSFGYSLADAKLVLKKEHKRRDAHCKEHHGNMSLVDLRLMRAFAKDGMVLDEERGTKAEGAKYRKSQYTEWAEFWARTCVPRVPDYRNTKWRMVNAERDYTYGVGVCRSLKKEAKSGRFKGRGVMRLKDDIRNRSKSKWFVRELKFASVDAVARAPDTVWNFSAKRRAMATRWGDRWDKVRGWFGRPPMDRSRKAREQIAESVSQESQNLPMNELVRRYQRQGISH